MAIYSEPSSNFSDEWLSTTHDVHWTNIDFGIVYKLLDKQKIVIWVMGIF